jgi:proprotein convertase subtilisin/kexin type 5
LKNGVCTQVNPNCRLSDENNGQCLTCYVGYSVQAGQCLLVPSAPDNEAPSDILCAQWKGKTCVKCSESSYFNGGLCTQVNPLCKTFDNNNGACLSCYSGYILLNSDCVLAPDNKAPADILCAQWQSGVCTKCSQGAFFRSGVCYQSDPLCKTFDSVYGSCTSCFSGYYLFNGQCLVSPAIPAAAPSDPACAKWQGSTCLQCSRSAYFKNGVCVESNTLCKTFDSTNGACTSCYYGYTIQGDNCVVANTTGNADPLCARWANGVCSQCAQSAYFSNGVCVQSNTFCKTFDSTNGACTSCYGGYDLANGDCVLAANPVDNSTVSDPNCAQWNGKVCVQCASDAFFQNGKCVEVDPLCKTWDNTNGNCLSCYKAFNLEGTKCVVAPNPIDNSQPSDILCAEWSGKTCLKCAQNAYFVNGVCNQANPLCKSYDNTNGDCLSCYNGYDLIAGKCVANNSTPTDKLCSQWNGAVCEKCSPFSYFSNGVCTQVDPKCKTFNSINGACNSCYGGYVLSNGGCNVDKSAPTDQLCAQWNGSVCVKCAQAAYFVNGICTQSNPQCRTFDNTNGNCLSCYAGYVLTAGNCLIRVQPPSQGPMAPNANFDVYCKKQVAGVCIECFFGFVLQNKKCVPNFDKVDCPAP